MASATSPPDPDRGAFYRRYLSSVVLFGLASAEASGFKGTDLYALSLLELAGSMTSGELAARTGLTTGATTRLIDRLEQRGHVVRVTDPADRRKVIVQAADHPAEIDAVVQAARDKIGAIITGYNEDQLSTLADYFTRATDAFQQATEDLRSAINRRLTDDEL